MVHNSELVLLRSLSRLCFNCLSDSALKGRLFYYRHLRSTANRQVSIIQIRLPFIKIQNYMKFELNRSFNICIKGHNSEVACL